MKLLLTLIVTLLLAVTVSTQRKGHGPKPKPSPSPTPTVTPSPSPVPSPTPILGDAWTTYGHDPHRSFASAGAIGSALAEAWRYRPTNAAIGSIHHVLATSDGIYARFDNSGGTGMARLNLDGTQRWLSFGCCNWDKGHWPSLTPDGSKLFVNDDNIFGILTATGARFGIQRIDTWGDTLIDPTGERFYTVNMHHQLDGCCTSFENVFVAAYDPSIRQLWRVWQSASGDNVYGPEDILGGAMALATDTLFIAQTWNGYGGRVPTLPPHGITAFNSMNGSKRWFVSTTPTSRLSVDGSRIYLIEGSANKLCSTCNAVVLTGAVLVARSQSNGALLWSAPVDYPVVYSNWTENADGSFTKTEWRGTHVQSPVLANGLVIIATINGIEAFDAATGVRMWINPAPGIAANDWGAQWSQAVNTRIAAALGSNTLVVTGNDGLIYVIDLTTGLTRWQGIAPSAVGVPENPVIVGNRLYVTDGTDVTNGGVIALISQ